MRPVNCSRFAESIAPNRRSRRSWDQLIQSIGRIRANQSAHRYLHHAKRHAQYTGAMRCTMCQRFLPKTARKGTRYCGTNCRSRAYRMREHQETASPDRPPVAPRVPPGLPKAAPLRRSAPSALTIPAVLEQLQQARERAGLPQLLTDPMLAYQANLDALLTEHMAIRRIVTTLAAGEVGTLACCTRNTLPFRAGG